MTETASAQRDEALLTKGGGILAGQGELVFENTAATNPYGTGTITLGNGVAVRGGTTGRTVVKAISVAGDVTIGTLATTNAVSNASNNLTFSGTTTLDPGAHTITVNGLLMVGTISGQLTGGDGVVKDGPGLLVLSNAGNSHFLNTRFSGATASWSPSSVSALMARKRSVESSSASISTSRPEL